MTHYLSPPFWGGGADPEVRLWVPFDGNSSADISAYSIGTGTVTAGTLTGNEYVVNGTALQNIVWTNSSLGRASGEAWTLEAFITWISNDAATNPCGMVMYHLGVKRWDFHIYGTLGKVGFDATGSVVFSNIAAFTTNVKTHVAMTRPAGAGAQTMGFYINGTRIQTWAEDGAHTDLTNATGSITIGKSFGLGQAANVKIDDVRFTKRERYTGASFTPPTSPF